jgi:hypothetical protein
MLENKNNIKLKLSVVSSIMNECGYKGLLTYISVETYKKIVKDEYVNFSMLKEISFIENENEWIHFMDKLVSMKLAIKNGSYYITRRKIKDWEIWVNDNCKISTKFNGNILINLTEFYKLKNNQNIKDFIYISLIDSVLTGKSISRRFLFELTGVKNKEQRKIEKRQTNLITPKSYIIPVSKKDPLINKPVFNGYLNIEKGKCKIIKDSLSTSKNAISNPSEKIVTYKDQINWAKYDFNKIYTFSEKGELKHLRNSINN